MGISAHLLLLLSLLPLALGEILTTRNGKPFTLESTVAMDAIFEEGEEYCGSLYYLNITSGCQVANPPFSAAFNASFPADALALNLTKVVPFLNFVSARKIGCSTYAQAFQQIFPSLESLPISARPKVFIAGSAINFFIGAAYDPFGDLDYEALPYRFVSIPLLDTIQVTKHAVSPDVCVSVKFGYMSTYFLGIGHYFTQVILGTIHVLCILMNLYEMHTSFKKRYWLRLTMFTACVLYPLLRLINFTWDDRNFFNRMGDHAYQALLWGGFMATYLADFSLLAMWLSVIKGDAIHNSIPPILSKVAMVIIPFVFIVGEVSALLGGIASADAALLSVYSVSSILLSSVKFTMVAFFLIFGLIIINRIRDNIMFGKNPLIFKITAAMLTTISAIFGMALIGCLNSYHQTTTTPIPGQRLLIFIVFWEIFPTIIILSPTLSFSSLPKLGNPLSSKSKSKTDSTIHSDARERTLSNSKARAHEEKDLAMSTIPSPV